MFTIVCQDCNKQEQRYQGVGIVDELCYDCEAVFMEKEGLWIDPAGGVHSKDEQDPAAMYE